VLRRVAGLEDDRLTAWRRHLRRRPTPRQVLMDATGSVHTPSPLTATAVAGAAPGSAGSSWMSPCLSRSTTPDVCPCLKSCLRLLHVGSVVREAHHHIQGVAVEEFDNDLPPVTRTLNAQGIPCGRCGDSSMAVTSGWVTPSPGVAAFLEKIFLISS
jgi:hypothetical protein